jgi:hypothetical protein
MWASLSPARRVVLAVGLVLVAVVCVTGAVVFAGAVRGSRPFTYTTAQAAPAELELAPDNADVTLEPSVDGQVHVEAHGHYAGRRPQVGLATHDGRLTISASCRSTWLHSCALRLDVSLPAQVPVVAHGADGAIRAQGLTGPLQLRTDNGALGVSDVRGALQLQTSNGTITADAVTSSTVSVRTDNGQVGLTFTGPPTSVDAQAANGRIDISVPTSVAYYVTTRTENGSIDTTTVPSDRFAHRTITARTNNGGIGVHAN